MKIRLVRAITFILFFMTSGIEVFGMKEKDDNDSTHSINDYNIPFEQFEQMKQDVNALGSSHHKTNPEDIFNINKKFEQMKQNVNALVSSQHKTNSKGIFNINNEKKNQGKNNKIFIDITKPFGKHEHNNLLFRYLLKRVECIYEGSLGITLFEILTSFCISILNNIVEFEKMDKNKFYANMLLFKFGFKLGIPILSFIIVDFNICIYNWLASGIKYLMVRYNKYPLEQLDIKWKAKSFKKNLKFIYLLNAFNIDIKLNLFGLLLCIPLTKILETLLIFKWTREVDYTRKTINSSYTHIEDMGDTYKVIYETVKTETRKAEEIIERINEASEEGFSTLEKISTQAKNILLPENDNNNNNPNNNPNNNNPNNNIDNNDEENE